MKLGIKWPYLALNASLDTDANIDSLAIPATNIQLQRDWRL